MIYYIMYPVQNTRNDVNYRVDNSHGLNYSVPKSKENDNFYLNIVINHDDSQGETPTAAEYNVTKTIPIVDRASDYYISVVRFDIPMNKIPLYIMPIVPNQGDPDLTPMIIGISYNGTDYPVNLEYIPDNTLNAPPQNAINQIITPYYYVYTYQNLINMINEALKEAWSNSGIAALLPNVLRPFFYFDSTTQLISLIVPKELTQDFQPPLSSKPQIFMNEALLNYLETFEVSFQGYNRPNGKDYIFILQRTDILPTNNQSYDIYGSTPPTFSDPTMDPPVSANYFKFTQEYPSMVDWISLRKLIVATNSIPINNEYIPANNNNSGINASFPILTDFVPALSNAGDSRSIAYYVPTSQYRLVDMTADTPIYKIDIKIYWEDKKGNLYPLYLSQYQQASLKIGFFRKTLYKSLGLLLEK